MQAHETRRLDVLNRAPRAEMRRMKEWKQRERSVKCAGEKDSSKVKGNRERESRQRAKQCKRTAVCKEHKRGKERERERQGAETIKGRKTLRKRRALFPRAVDHYLSPGPLRVGCRGSGWGLRGCFFSTLVGDLRVLFFMVFHTHTHRHTHRHHKKTRAHRSTY